MSGEFEVSSLTSDYLRITTFSNSYEGDIGVNHDIAGSFGVQVANESDQDWLVQKLFIEVDANRDFTDGLELLIRQGQNRVVIPQTESFLVPLDINKGMRVDGQVNYWDQKLPPIPFIMTLRAGNQLQCSMIVTSLSTGALLYRTNFTVTAIGLLIPREQQQGVI